MQLSYAFEYVREPVDVGELYSERGLTTEPSAIVGDVDSIAAACDDGPAPTRW